MKAVAQLKMSKGSYMQQPLFMCKPHIIQNWSDNVDQNYLSLFNFFNNVKQKKIVERFFNNANTCQNPKYFTDLASISVIKKPFNYFLITLILAKTLNILQIWCSQAVVQTYL